MDQHRNLPKVSWCLEHINVRKCVLDRAFHEHQIHCQTPFSRAPLPRSAQRAELSSNSPARSGSASGRKQRRSNILRSMKPIEWQQKTTGSLFCWQHRHNSETKTKTKTHTTQHATRSALEWNGSPAHHSFIGLRLL